MQESCTAHVLSVLKGSLLVTRVCTIHGQLLHVDIVFIAGKPRLFTVDDITGYIVIARMESKGQADVNKAQLMQ